VNVVYLTLLACAAAASMLVLRYDLYEREPWPMLIAAAAVGATVMWSIGFLEDATLARCGGPTAGPPVGGTRSRYATRDLSRFESSSSARLGFPAQYSVIHRLVTELCSAE
jgi:hypothetical protein